MRRRFVVLAHSSVVILFLIGLVARLQGLTTTSGLFRDDAWVIAPVRAPGAIATRLTWTFPGFAYLERSIAAISPTSTLLAQALPFQYCSTKFDKGGTPVAPEYKCALPILFVNCRFTSSELLPTSVVCQAEDWLIRPSTASNGQLPKVFAVANTGCLRARSTPKSVPKGKLLVLLGG